jgi:hypothetical protein
MAFRSGDVLLCYVIPEVRFVGAGRAMLTTVEQIACNTGIQSLYLNSTFTTHAFYIGNGFETSGLPLLAFGMESLSMAKCLNDSVLRRSICQIAAFAPPRHSPSIFQVRS